MTVRKEAIVTAWMSGMSGPDVAARFGVTRQYVSLVIRAAELPPRQLVSKRAMRFWRNVDQTGAGCWEWQGTRQPFGYGLAYVPGRRRLGAHRVSWELTHGPIPDGLWVLHACDNPPCVRPDHLFLGTPRDNTRDAMAKGRWHGANRTHCKNGHRLPAFGSGDRTCKVCKAAYDAARRPRKAA